jgi:hypothetical protein
MHGTMLCGLRSYLVTEYGEGTWEEVLSTAAVPRQLFVPVTEYPDRYYHQLVGAAAEVTGQEASAVERSLGRQLVDDVVDSEPATPEDVLALLVDVESWATPAFGADQRGPLDAVRLDEHRARLTYDCPNGLCRVVRGVVDAVAAGAGTDVVVQESECMHDGHQRCSFVVTASATATTRCGRSTGGAPGVTD